MNYFINLNYVCFLQMKTRQTQLCKTAVNNLKKKVLEAPVSNKKYKMLRLN